MLLLKGRTLALLDLPQLLLGPVNGFLHLARYRSPLTLQCLRSLYQMLVVLLLLNQQLSLGVVDTSNHLVLGYDLVAVDHWIGSHIRRASMCHVSRA